MTTIASTARARHRRLHAAPAPHPAGTPRPRMHDLTIGPWQLRVDPAATRAAHATPDAAGESCQCRECRNMDAAFALPDAVPAELRALLAALGAEHATWARRFHVDALDSGLHLYGGWLHVVGELVAGPECRTPIGDGAIFELALEPLGARAAVGFSRTIQLPPDVLAGRPLVQVELQVELPWVLAEPPEASREQPAAATRAD